MGLRQYLHLSIQNFPQPFKVPHTKVLQLILDTQLISRLGLFADFFLQVEQVSLLAVLDLRLHGFELVELGGGDGEETG
jgi:hypothetical protein